MRAPDERYFLRALFRAPPRTNRVRRRRVAGRGRRAARARREGRVDKARRTRSRPRTFQALRLPARLRTHAQGRRRGPPRWETANSRAQIAALLLKLPDPPASAASQPDALQKRRLARDLVACGLLKTNAGWDDKHLRTGAPPNLGWFAPKSGEPGAEKRDADASPAAGAPSRGGEAPAFVPPLPAAAVTPLLANDLSATALRGLAMLARANREDLSGTEKDRGRPAIRKPVGRFRFELSGGV